MQLDEKARSNKAELDALLERAHLLQIKQELLEQQAELVTLRAAVARGEKNEKELLCEVERLERNHQHIQGAAVTTTTVKTTMLAKPAAKDKSDSKIKEQPSNTSEPNLWDKLVSCIKPLEPHTTALAAQDSVKAAEAAAEGVSTAAAKAAVDEAKVRAAKLTEQAAVKEAAELLRAKHEKEAAIAAEQAEAEAKARVAAAAAVAKAQAEAQAAAEEKARREQEEKARKEQEEKARKEQEEQEKLAAQDGCYLLFTEARGGAFITQWSQTLPEGLEPLAHFKPETPVALFKYTNNGGQAELCKGVGGPNKKLFYQGWVSFLRAAFGHNGKLTFFRNVEACPVAILFSKSDTSVLRFEKDAPLRLPADIVAVAVTPPLATGLDVQKMPTRNFTSVGEKVGATFSLDGGGDGKPEDVAARLYTARQASFERKTARKKREEAEKKKKAEAEAGKAAEEGA